MIDTEFGIIIDLLIGAYGEKFQITDLKADTYFKFLKKYEAKKVYDAACYWIKRNKFPPAISDFIEILGD